MIMVLVLVCLTLNFVNAKVLKIGVGTGLQPYAWTNEKNELIGFDVEVSAELAKRMGYEPEHVNMNFVALIPALMTDKIDMMESATTITDARAKKVDFSIPYYTNINGYAMSVKSDNDKNDIKTMQDLKGKRVATVVASVQTEILEKMGGVEIVEYESLSESFLALAHGKVEATLQPVTSTKSYIEGEGKGKIKVVGEQVPSKPIGAAVKKGNKQLLEKLNKAMLSMLKDGSINKIALKYGMPANTLKY
ncbi:MAG: basic amino acid ABC transporter substrate-binding protein [Rickettsiales bacterium]|nr:MAG: basic amino acid ABC transporter substrate-binding protein [Rickettsiales bacterium]